MNRIWALQRNSLLKISVPRKFIRMASSSEEFPRSVQKNGRYCIPWTIENRPSVLKVLHKFYTSPETPQVPSQKELDKIEEMKIMEVNKEQIDKPQLSPQSIQLTWLGHAGFLAQFQGLNVLFDPVFSERIGPISSIAGQKRFRKCALSISELPPIDLVCVSHDHYDHLDRPSVISLHKRFGGALKWCVPLGMDDWLRSTLGKDTNGNDVNCMAFDWWQREPISCEENKEAYVEFVPAQHWCLRGNIVRKGWSFSSDENTRLWGGWVIDVAGTSIYHAGDTGYYENIFKGIGKRHGPIDLALIPIGAYSPRSVLKFQHVNPDEAVQIHKDVQARRSVAMHWGTFELAREHFLEPVKLLTDALQENEIDEDNFITMKHGETKIFNKD